MEEFVHAAIEREIKRVRARLRRLERKMARRLDPDEYEDLEDDD